MRGKSTREVRRKIQFQGLPAMVQLMIQSEVRTRHETNTGRRPRLTDHDRLNEYFADDEPEQRPRIPSGGDDGNGVSIRR